FANHIEKLPFQDLPTGVSIGFAKLLGSDPMYRRQLGNKREARRNELFDVAILDYELVAMAEDTALTAEDKHAIERYITNAKGGVVQDQMLIRRRSSSLWPSYQEYATSLVNHAKSLSLPKPVSGK